MNTHNTITTGDGRTIPLSELERVAQAATPGPIKVAGANEKTCWLLPDCFPRDCWITVEGCDRVANAAHIAAFDRETCLTLIAEVRRQAEKIASLREKLQFSEGYRELDCRSIQIKNEEIASLREQVAELEVGHGTTSIRPVFPIQPEDMP